MIPPPSGNSFSTKRQGYFGEQIATDYLVSNGYAIRERNWVIRPYEVDIIAQDGDTLVFVEVKLRRVLVRADKIVNRKKQDYLIRAARAYITRYQPHLKVRFDVIFIIGTYFKYDIQHLKNAFTVRVKSY